MNHETRAVADESDGITVTKRLDEEHYTHPAVTYAVSSERDVETTVRLVESPPGDVRPDQLGFHSGYGSEFWRFEDGNLVFEYTIEPDEEFTTVVGVRDVDDELVQQFLTDFEEFTVRPERESDASMADGRIPELEGSEPPAGEDGRGDGSTVERSTGRADAVRETGGESSESFTRGGQSTSPQRATEDGDALPADPGTAAVESSTDARIRQLQADVANLRSYTAALESFLDEHGSAEHVIGEFEERLDAIEAEVDRIGATVESHDETLSRLDDEVEEVSDDVRRHDSELSDADQRLDRLAERLDGFEDLSDLDERVSDIRADLDEMDAWRERMRDVFAN